MNKFLIAGLAVSLSACAAFPNVEKSEPITLTPAKVRLYDNEGLGVGEILGATTPDEWVTIDPANTLYIDIPQGRVIVELTADLAPNHVAQIKTLVREGYYDGLDFYRVVAGFVAQGGDASGEKDKGAAAQSLVAEFEEPFREGLAFTPLGNEDGYADEVGFINGFPAGRDLEDNSVWLAHCTGAFAFGRENARDTASTEFYITLQPQRYLDRNLTVFGRVVWGMENVQAIKRGAPGNGGAIEDENDWTKIASIKLASDVAQSDRLVLERLDSNSVSFKKMIAARRNRPEEFFYFRPDYVDLCQLQLPVRVKEAK